MALLHFLCKDCAGLELQIVAAHVNHCLRGEESDADEEFARQAAADYGVEFHSIHADIRTLSNSSKEGLEVCGRRIRYRFFEDLAGKEGQIATAHTLSDRAETLFLNLVRGCGLQGLGSIPPVRGKIVRPLIDCSRQEVESYCSENGLLFVTDSSNLSDLYTRNKIRLQVLPALTAINPSLLDSVRHLTDSVREDQEFLQQQARQAYMECRTAEGLDILKTAALAPAIRSRVCSLFLSEKGIPCDYQRITETIALIMAGRGRSNPSGTCFLEAYNGVLACYPSQEEKVAFDFSFSMQKQKDTFVLPDGREICVQVVVGNESDGKNLKNIYKNVSLLIMDCDKIDKIVKIRQRQAGDTICFSHRRGTKTLKKLFNELRIPPRDRDVLPVLADRQGVIGIPGMGISQRVVPDQNTKRLCLCSFTNKNLKTEIKNL
ncbi:MAG TPA: tRNA lysidine(34) synthetase TilS [Firmicutes bacterium]|nr:tRNA lysidine(34) synthetase TilS [Bacillota bacterium]